MLHTTLPPPCTQGKLVRKYDFGFGFCIPNSVNTWEAIYDLPQYKEAEVLDYVSAAVQLRPAA